MPRFVSQSDPRAERAAVDISSNTAPFRMAKCCVMSVEAWCAPLHFCSAGAGSYTIFLSILGPSSTDKAPQYIAGERTA